MNIPSFQGSQRSVASFWFLIMIHICLLCFASAAWGESETNSGSNPWTKDDGADRTAWYQDVWAHHIKPSAIDGFDRNGLYFIGGSIAAVGIAQPFDYSVRDAWIDHQRMSASVSTIFDYVGQGYLGIGIALGQLAIDRDNGIFHSETLIASFLATSILKGVNERLRPDGSDHYSMPSGHTSTTFATATALSYSYGPWVGVPAYAVAIATGASRWSDNRHWLSDTVAGAAVGIFWARAVHFHHFKHDTDAAKKVNLAVDIIPVFDPEVAGFMAHVQF